ncbi:hypothetical protein BV25DRAFT_1807295 [Artomyces pyxidatus]|uniref:Uncharacterized protein n=1 Tax=Artomyces pyxidatus TaxID=48021 RepID=A0ACB8SVK7_9AGAM|nr:hypothetical protein BV25DRAFT_1807295 [Artomyces pyxidatus]
MCHRLVGITRFACGHDVPMTSNTEDCGSTTCIYSANHSQSAHDCASTCTSWYVFSVFVGENSDGIQG